MIDIHFEKFLVWFGTVTMGSRLQIKGSGLAGLHFYYCIGIMMGCIA